MIYLLCALRVKVTSVFLYIVWYRKREGMKGVNECRYPINSCKVVWSTDSLSTHFEAKLSSCSVVSLLDR